MGNRHHDGRWQPVGADAGGLYALTACDHNNPTRGMRYLTADPAKVTCRRCLRVMARSTARALEAAT